MKRTTYLLYPIIAALLLSWCITPAEAGAKELPTKQKIALLQPIEHYAMQYGEGETRVYVFVDPKCPHSQDFISMINENSKIRSIYRYYIFFYELKRFKSHDLIAAIYGSSAPLQKMLEVMVGKKEIETAVSADPKIEQKIDEIERVSEEIGVSKRPYLIIAKERD